MASGFSRFDLLWMTLRARVDETPGSVRGTTPPTLWITPAETWGYQRPGETVTSTRWNSLSSE